MLLTAMIFASNADAQSRIQRYCGETRDLHVAGSTESRPPVEEMVRTIRANNPELLLIEFQDRDDALQIEEAVRASCPNAAILGFANDWQDESLIRTAGGYLRVLANNV